MPPSLRDVTRDFALGEATLEALRAAARAERGNRPLADEILRLIGVCERSGRTDSARVRAMHDLRDRARALAPPGPDKPASDARRPPGESIYEAGLRGQRRRG